jgi:hypothetical protein
MKEKNMSFLREYLDGNFEVVWSRINRLQEIPSPLEEDIEAVCSEMVRRINFNIDICIRNLSSVGYELGYTYVENLDDPARNWHFVKAPIRELPNGSIDNVIQSFQQRVERLPLFMKYWFRYVGGVNFIGKRPSRWKRPKGLEMNYTEIDPLTIPSLDVVIRDNLIEENYNQMCMLIALDVFTKEGMSGGGYYRLLLKDSLVDGRIPWNGDETLFVDYIRRYFRDGGLYGVETWDGVTEEDLRILRSDIIDF